MRRKDWIVRTLALALVVGLVASLRGDDAPPPGWERTVAEAFASLREAWRKR